MDKSKPAADRVRPILQAMERSIDAARQRRTHGGRPAPAPQPTRDEPTQNLGPDGVPRQRARPKRSTPLTNMNDRTPLRPDEGRGEN